MMLVLVRLKISWSLHPVMSFSPRCWNISILPHKQADVDLMEVDLLVPTVCDLQISPALIAAM